MKPTNVNQLWLADITYIRPETEFVYLAIVLDAFSRRVIGWALDRTLEAKLALAALEWPCPAVVLKRAWYIIPTAAFSTRQAITPPCSISTAFKSA
jgi:hypothetical protein